MNLCSLLGVSYSDDTENLLSVVAQCHHSAALANKNASSVAVQLSASCGSTFEHSVASALLLYGAKHGPIGPARENIYTRTQAELDDALDRGEIIAGWGNAFFKTCIDPSWAMASHLLKTNYSEHDERIAVVSERIFKVRGRVLYPNASAFSAVACEVAGVERGTEMSLAIVCRLSAWARLYSEQAKQ